MRLQEVDIVFISPDHNEKYRRRKQHIINMLSNIGCTRVTHYVSSNINYPFCLLDAEREILSTHLDSPVLILEDDIQFIGIDTFDFVPDADAIYLGISKCEQIYIQNRDNRGSKFQHYSDSQVKVINMLSSHAILYISREFKEAVIEAIDKYKYTYYYDILLSHLQKDFKILANKKPLFYQSKLFNNSDTSEKATDIIIEDNLRCTSRNIQ